MFLLNLQGKDPIFEQIKEQVLQFIELGILRPGDKLPSVRQLAQDNGINPNTVAKAYRELENSGVIYNQPKKGAFIKEINQSKARKDHLSKAILTLKAAGFSKKEVLETVESTYKEEME